MHRGVAAAAELRLDVVAAVLQGAVHPRVPGGGVVVHERVPAAAGDAEPDDGGIGRLGIETLLEAHRGGQPEPGVPAVEEGLLHARGSREEIVEQRVVNSAALRMILHGESERIFPQANLLDDPVVRGPRLHLQFVA